MNKEKKLAFGLELVLLGFAAMQSSSTDIGLLEILTILAAVGSIGAVSSYAFTLIRVVFPVIDEEIAQFASLGLALVVGLAARMALPYVPSAPAWVNTYLPYLVYIAEQIWYLIQKDSPKYVEARALGAAYKE